MEEEKNYNNNITADCRDSSPPSSCKYLTEHIIRKYTFEIEFARLDFPLCFMSYLPSSIFCSIPELLYL